MPTTDPSRPAMADGSALGGAGDPLPSDQPLPAAGEDWFSSTEAISRSDQYRQEIEKRSSVRGEASLASARRSERQFVRARLPMEVEHKGATYPGFDISLMGFSCVGSPAIDDDVVDDFAIHLLFHGYRLTIQVKASRVRQIETEELNGFQIVEIDDAQCEVLRKALRAHLSGQLITLDGVLVAADSQTARRRNGSSGQDANPSISGTALWRRRLRYCGLALATCALVLVLATSLFQRFVVFHSAFATVTATKLDINAPSDGEVREHRTIAGDRVKRDQLLLQIRDRNLDADLQLAQERVDMARQLLDSARQPSDLPSLTAFLEGSKSVLEQNAGLEAAAGLEQAELTSLELRAEANKLYAPCACTVLWAVPAGDWVGKGERLATLARTAGDDLLIEALVPFDAIDRIGPDQVAFLSLPNVAKLIEAKVETVTMDPLRQPRAGFPAWLRKEKRMASILLRPNHPLTADMIGRPVQVIFSDLPEVTIGAAQLRVETTRWMRALIPLAKQALSNAQRAVLATIDSAGNIIASDRS